MDATRYAVSQIPISGGGEYYLARSIDYPWLTTTARTREDALDKIVRLVEAEDQLPDRRDEGEGDGGPSGRMSADGPNKKSNGPERGNRS